MLTTTMEPHRGNVGTALSVDQKLEPGLSTVEKRLQPGYPWNRCGTTLTFPSPALGAKQKIKTFREIDGRAKLVKPYGDRNG